MTARYIQAKSFRMESRVQAMWSRWSALWSRQSRWSALGSGSPWSGREGGVSRQAVADHLYPSSLYIMKSTKVLNPRRCIMRVHEKYACGTDTHAVQIRTTSFTETVNTRASRLSYVGR